MSLGAETPKAVVRLQRCWATTSRESPTYAVSPQVPTPFARGARPVQQSANSPHLGSKQHPTTQDVERCGVQALSDGVQVVSEEKLIGATASHQLGQRVGQECSEGDDAAPMGLEFQR